MSSVHAASMYAGAAAGSRVCAAHGWRPSPGVFAQVADCVAGTIYASAVASAFDYALRMGAHIVQVPHGRPLHLSRSRPPAMQPVMPPACRPTCAPVMRVTSLAACLRDSMPCPRCARSQASFGDSYPTGFAPTQPAPWYYAGYIQAYQAAMQPLSDAGILVVAAAGACAGRGSRTRPRCSRSSFLRAARHAGNDNIDLDALLKYGYSYNPCLIQVCSGFFLSACRYFFLHGAPECLDCMERSMGAEGNRTPDSHQACSFSFHSLPTCMEHGALGVIS